jgi:hypothetical protein
VAYHSTGCASFKRFRILLEFPPFSFCQRFVAAVTYLKIGSCVRANTLILYGANFFRKER